MDSLERYRPWEDKGALVRERKFWWKEELTKTMGTRAYYVEKKTRLKDWKETDLYTVAFWYCTEDA
jgi:hypothetical protein